MRMNKEPFYIQYISTRKKKPSIQEKKLTNLNGKKKQNNKVFLTLNETLFNAYNK